MIKLKFFANRKGMNMKETTFFSNMKSFYKLTAWLAIAMVIYSISTIIIIGTIGAQPESAGETFTMLQENLWVGLLRLDLLTLIIMPLYYIFILAFTIAMKPLRNVYVLLGALLGICGNTLFLATPSLFSWLELFKTFQASTDTAVQAQLISAGEILLASDMWHGSGAQIGGVLLQTSMTIFSALMLKTSAFNKWTAWSGIIVNGLDLLRLLIGFFAPSIGIMIFFVAGPLYFVWYPLLARDFLRLARLDKETN
jgi:hypothetical protein